MSVDRVMSLQTSYTAVILTLGRFELGAARGVPSRFSAGFAFDIVSSRNGRTLRSAYFRQLMPQLSHSTFVAKPLGAFHHVSDSRVRQAPQLLSLRVSSVTMDPSSSELSGGGGEGAGFPASRAAFIRAFCSPSFALSRCASITQKTPRTEKLRTSSSDRRSGQLRTCSVYRLRLVLVVTRRRVP